MGWVNPLRALRLIYALCHRYWDKMQEALSVIILRCFFNQYKVLNRKMGETLLLLMSKFDENLNEPPKIF